MGELARGLAVELHDLAAQRAQQLRDHRAADRIDGIDHHAEPAAAHRLGIDQRERQHLTDVLVVVGFAHEHAAQRIHLGKEVVLLLGQRQHALALGVGEELALIVEQLEGVPLTGVVRRGDDDAAVGAVVRHGQLDARRGAQAHVHHVGSAAEQRALDEAFDHAPRNTGVAADDDGKFFAWIRFRTQPHVSRGEFYDIEGREVVALGSAYGAPNARNGLYECHISYKKCYTYIN